MVNSYDLVVCKKHGHLFELFYKYSFEPVGSIMEFIYSREQKEFDERTMIAASQDEMYSFATFIQNREFKLFDYSDFENDVLFYIGYVTQYIGYHEELPLCRLFTKEDIEWMWQNYDVLHTQEVLYVWELIKEKHAIQLSGK